jgi:hypothetical protein
MTRIKPTEHSEQCAVIEWANAHESQYPVLKRLHAVPNGGHRHIAVAVKMKAEGQKPGVPDLDLPYPNRKLRKHGLRIEMKITGGRVSPEQQDWIDYLNSVGYMAVVCWSADEAIETIQQYIGVN